MIGLIDGDQEEVENRGGLRSFIHHWREVRQKDELAEIISDDEGRVSTVQAGGGTPSASN